MKSVPPFNTFLEIIIKLVLFCLTTLKKKKLLTFANIKDLHTNSHQQRNKVSKNALFW